MTKKELLNTYRAKVIELEELRYQLNRVGTDGRPNGCRTMQLDGTGRGTNDRGAAALQLAEGLEAFVDRKEAELRTLQPSMEQLLMEIPDARTYMVIQHYYVLARTDEEIGSALAMSRTRANQIRRLYMKAI